MSTNKPRGSSYLGELVRELRAKKGLSQEGLARACNMSTSHVNKIEGTLDPQIGRGKLETMAAVLGVDKDVLTLLAGKTPDCVLSKLRESMTYAELVVTLSRAEEYQLEELADAARFDS